MEYRFGRENEFAAIRRLWGQCFGDEEPWTSWYFSHHYKAQQTWVGIDSGEVVAQAHLLPHRLFLRGAWRETAYFVGVCVEERLRGRGIGREVMATALAELRRTGIGISVLQPRWPNFYRQLGWDFCYSRQKYYLPMAVARLLLPETPAEISWDPDCFRLDTFAELYEAFMQGRHGYAKRDESAWRLLLADHRGDGGKTGVVFWAGQACAYVFYKAVGEILYIREMAWTGSRQVDSTLKCLLGEAEALGATQLEWDDPAGELVSVLFEDSRNEPFLMGRLSNIQTTLETMDYPPELSINLALELTDPLLESNQGRFLWQIDRGKSQLVRQADQSNALINGSVKAESISIDIAGISQLYFGQKSARDIMAEKTGISLDNGNLATLEKIFPVCRNYISEYF